MAVYISFFLFPSFPSLTPIYMICIPADNLRPNHLGKASDVARAKHKVSTHCKHSNALSTTQKPQELLILNGTRDIYPRLEAAQDPLNIISSLYKQPSSHQTQHHPTTYQHPYHPRTTHRALQIAPRHHTPQPDRATILSILWVTHLLSGTPAEGPKRAARPLHASASNSLAADVPVSNSKRFCSRSATGAVARAAPYWGA